MIDEPETGQVPRASTLDLAALDRASLDPASLDPASLDQKIDPLVTARIIAIKGGWSEGAMCSLGRPKKTYWAWTVATFFGAGFGKPGPGTWGSVAATLIFAGTAYFFHPSTTLLLTLTLVGIALSIILGVPAATISEREAARTDPGFVVIDEVAGVWITLLGAVYRPDWKRIVLALLLFRVFDIFKPFPIRKLEKLPGGWGIVFDDVAAGLYAWAVLVAISHWL